MIRLWFFEIFFILLLEIASSKHHPDPEKHPFAKCCETEREVEHSALDEKLESLKMDCMKQLGMAIMFAYCL